MVILVIITYLNTNKYLRDLQRSVVNKCLSYKFEDLSLTEFVSKKKAWIGSVHISHVPGRWRRRWGLRETVTLASSVETRVPARDPVSKPKIQTKEKANSKGEKCQGGWFLRSTPEANIWPPCAPVHTHNMHTHLQTTQYLNRTSRCF